MLNIFDQSYIMVIKKVCVSKQLSIAMETNLYVSFTHIFQGGAGKVTNYGIIR